MVNNSGPWGAQLAGTLGGQAMETVEFAGTRLFVESAAGETQEEYLSDVAHKTREFGSLTILE